MADVLVDDSQKRPAVKDPTFKPRAGETSESGGSDLGDGLSRGKAKRSKKDTSVEVVITAENGDARELPPAPACVFPKRC